MKTEPSVPSELLDQSPAQPTAGVSLSAIASSHYTTNRSASGSGNQMHRVDVSDISNLTELGKVPPHSHSYLHFCTPRAIPRSHLSIRTTMPWLSNSAVVHRRLLGGWGGLASYTGQSMH